MFEVGQKVVCVNDEWDDAERGITRPSRGTVYTVRSYGHDGAPDSIRLVEIVNPQKSYAVGYCECSFLSVRFAPLRKTSIEVFERLLVDAPVKVREPSI